MVEVTRAIAEYMVNTPAAVLDAGVCREAKRAYLNFFACAIGASQHETIDAMLAAVLPFSGKPEAPVFGRRIRLDALNAALVNGTSSHVFDFDDTILSCTLHPTGPVAAAQLALAAHRPVSGADLLLAFVLGVEIETRIAQAIHERHYPAGWHITGTVGVLGAAAACGRMLGLSVEQMTYALGTAATQASGLRAMFGSMGKPFHVGHAARGGLLAALLAERNFTSSSQGLEGRRGFAEILGCGLSLDQVPRQLGQGFALMTNSYKPYACGVVLHPVIDACLSLRDFVGPSPDRIERIELRVHPLVIELTGNMEPRTGLEGKFSVYHAAAAAFVRGDGGEEEFEDRAVQDGKIQSLRRLVVPLPDPDITPDETRIRVVLRNGEAAEHHVAHASGSIDNPMSDAQLENKLRRLASRSLPVDAIDRLIEQCWTIDVLAQAQSLVDASGD